MDAETLNYKKRKSKRTYCTHCRKEQKHHCCFDPHIKKWVEICTCCEMVELADDELTKIGTDYNTITKKK